MFALLTPFPLGAVLVVSPNKIFLVISNRCIADRPPTSSQEQASNDTNDTNFLRGVISQAAIVAALSGEPEDLRLILYSYRAAVETLSNDDMAPDYGRRADARQTLIRVKQRVREKQKGVAAKEDANAAKAEGNREDKKTLDAEGVTGGEEELVEDEAEEEKTERGRPRSRQGNWRQQSAALHAKKKTCGTTMTEHCRSACQG
ncbi:hypothetical protein BAUCODRAFT_28400 [Baudoinia panamericana UAMH 10762]|uniref:Uncharacterized protein n=1 Tax=Baudoinia panamericana (strain UAMH 10762) TaxID=717646 RepID=M2MX90_BAUPA|nr:uncharacterized protein BAUCODRAFT_28400 [Baudoinia panamericana UAMH 10762]EMC91269.1 hypothetical protein BAUCODRAFT_28400 [Baudoinia panamericana UAMH 10762]